MRKYLQLQLDRINAARATVGASLLAFGAQVFAAVPEAVSAELTTAKADVMTIGGLVFAIAIGVVLFKWFKRSL